MWQWSEEMLRKQLVKDICPGAGDGSLVKALPSDV
jgi:hypothetical protein